MKRRRSCSEFSASTGCSSTSSRQFSSCIRMYAFFATNPFSSTKIIQQKLERNIVEDNLIVDKLKASLLKTAQSRGDDWGTALKSLSLDAWKGSTTWYLVTEETLYHLRCKLLFKRGHQYSKTEEEGKRKRGQRKIDEEREAVFIEFCEWFHSEFEHRVMTRPSPRKAAAI